MPNFRCDRMPLGSIKVIERADVGTPDAATGFLRIDMCINGVGVYQYGDASGATWGELRLPVYVFDAAVLKAWQMSTLTNDHPPEAVTKDNRAQYDAGGLGSNVREENQTTRSDGTAKDPRLVADILGGKVQTSCGYSTTLIPAHDPLIHELAQTTDGLIPATGPGLDGTLSGVPFRWLQTDYEPNHVAIVDQARGGPACKIDGAAWTVETEQRIDTMPTIMIKGEAIEVDPRVAAAFAELKPAESDAPPPPPAAGPPVPPPETDEGDMPREESKDALDALRATVDTLRAERDADKIRIDALESVGAASRRGDLIENARRVLGADAKLDGLDELGVMRAVAVATCHVDLRGAMATESAAYVKATYDAAIRSVGKSDADNLRGDILTFASDGARKSSTADAVAVARRRAGVKTKAVS